MKQIIISLLLLLTVPSFSQVCEDQYGKVVISEVFFDTRFNEKIADQFHHYGEYIELYNSSDTAIDLTGWTIKDNHTQFTLTSGYLGNSNLIIQPGGYKIITYGGFYYYGNTLSNGQYFNQGSPITNDVFVKFFPEIASLPNFQLSDIILQNTMVLDNNLDEVSLLAPNGKLIDHIDYGNDSSSNALYVAGTNTPQQYYQVSTFLDNNDGGVFYGPMAGIPRRIDPNNASAGFLTDPVTGERIYDIDNNLKKSIYRSTTNGYYSNQETVFAVETASPFTNPNVTVPLKPIDPFMLDLNPIYPNNDNATEVIAYDIKTQAVIGQAKTYFDDLGKPTVSISKDFQNNLSWATETVYDNFGRKWKESFPTVTCRDFANAKYLSDPNLKSQFLDKFYSNNNTYETYQATAEQPYSEINYDNSLNPGSVINVVGGNKIVDSSGTPQWKTGYSYTVPAAQEMYYAYGYNYYDGPIANGKEEVITKFFKSVSVDANGVENVAFSDGEGKTLAAARSGGPANYPVYSLIGTQGFVDIHIPAGAPAGTLIGNPANYKVFNLKTGLELTPTPASLPSGEGYRVEALTVPLTDPKVYIDQTPAGGAITYDAGALGVTYSVNYYDYTLNVYNKTGQLIKNVQPNGYTANTVIKDVPTHMQSGATAFISTYTYNDQGQIKEVTSPDEGTSRFAYRNDGQIRYSQSQIQADTKVSYTNYDKLARPVESGVITGATGIWATAAANTDGTLVAGTTSEQTGTIYDFIDNNTTSITIPTSLSLSSVLTAEGINPANYTQENLAGSVACTFSKTATTINAITWYNYDVYGRVVWVVQYNEGLGAKTIHYEYDYKGNVTKVLFQKDKATEMFVHRYTYNSIDNALIKVETSTNNTDFITHAEYSYYVTGELKRVNIAQGAQGLDYVYTLGGQLKSINHPSLLQADDPGKDANDVFGLILDYHEGDYKRDNTNIAASPTIAGSNQDFNGNIKAARWGNRSTVVNGAVTGSANTAAYTYNYNRNGWMQSATYGTFNTAGAITPNSLFAEKNLDYDPNGNIKKLQRTNQTGTVIDDFTYNYNSNNQLNNVTDAVNPGVSYDIDSQPTNNYQYNAIGQLVKNVSENLEYVYNTQGLTTEVKQYGEPRVKFFYNERGQRIKKESYSGPTLLSTTYYALDISGNTMAVYTKNGNDPMTQNELPIYGASRLGVYARSYNMTPAQVNYQITDHLGNVRAVIRKLVNNPIVAIFTADYYPFGEKLPTKDKLTGQYRYAFQGQELDGETGMEAFQLRLWDGRIGRWLNPDPYGQFVSPYVGMGNNPIGMIDPNGGWCSDANGNSIPCPDGYASYDNFWNHTTVLNEIFVSNSNTEFGPQPMPSNYTYPNFTFGSDGNGTAFFTGVTNNKEFDSTFFGATSSLAFMEGKAYLKLDGKYAIDKLGADFAYMKGEGSYRLGTKDINYTQSIKGEFLSANAMASGGILTTNKMGARAQLEAGAYTVRAESNMQFNILGMQVSLTAGGSAGSIHAGVSGGIYYNKTDGKLYIEDLAHLGLGLGAKLGGNASIPVSWIWGDNR